MYYYTSEEESVIGRPPLGSIFLPGNHVLELPFNPTDNEKFLFEIVSGKICILLFLCEVFGHKFISSLLLNFNVYQNTVPRMDFYTTLFSYWWVQCHLFSFV
jgi:hypothetical protein